MTTHYIRVFKSARAIKRDCTMKTIRLLIAEHLLGLAMEIAPDGTEEKTDIADFCVSYFSKRLRGDY